MSLYLLIIFVTIWTSVGFSVYDLKFDSFHEHNEIERLKHQKVCICYFSRDFKGKELSYILYKEKCIQESEFVHVNFYYHLHYLR